jgi:uncharacterized membrane protein YvlD (DUF360 family)
LVHGFHVPGFWSAFFGAILLSLITGFVSGSEKRPRRRLAAIDRGGSDKVIDI